jgi:hypothetical protein
LLPVSLGESQLHFLDLLHPLSSASSQNPLDKNVRVPSSLTFLSNGF